MLYGYNNCRWWSVAEVNMNKRQIKLEIFRFCLQDGKL